MTFKFAGVSTDEKGNTKVRFANDQMRIKVLVKGGHTNVSLLELPEALDKPAVVTYLKTSELMELPIARQAIEEADEKYNSVKVKRATSAKSAKKDSTDTMASLKARAAQATE